jgi:hypothetical protein
MMARQREDKGTGDQGEKKDRDCGSSGYSPGTCGKIQSGGIHEGGKGKAGRAERRDGSGEGRWGRRLADREEGHFLNHIFWGREKEREEEEEERPSEVTDWAGMPGCGYADD